LNKNLEMSRIKKTSPLLNLSNFQTFIVDNNPLSQYFKISELGDLFTAGKNGFLIEGSTFLKPSTEIKIEVLDTEGNPLFVEPGEGIPEYYEGLSKLIGVYVYEDTPIGIGKITILGELDTWLDENGFPQPIPEDWAGIYNVKWERDIKINKNIPNETRVRFVRRPEVIIEELNESFYSRNLVNATQTDGLVRGIALTPTEGTTLRGYRGGIRYLVQKQSGGFFDGGNFISVTGTGIQNAEIVEYLNSSSVVVATPFTSSDGLVSNFSGKNYSLSYQYNQNPVASSILGSFGRFEINQLQTFVGDVERIKVFKKSRASNVDYEVIQDTRVESSEILTAIVSGSAIDVGHFSASYENGQSWNSFWTTQSNAGDILDSSKIYRAVKLRNNRLSTNLGDDIRLESGSEYALEFYNYYDTSSNNPNDKLNVYLTSTLRSGSGISNYYLTQSLAVLTGSNEFRSANKRVYNFVPPITDNWAINFESSNTTSNSYWHVGSVSLKAAHELGFSPDEFNFIIPIDRDLERETFDFKFEFFDINNNYVPITVTSAKTFQSGNIGLIDKNIIIDTDKQFFNFSSSLEGSPIDQTINITGTKNRILGNLLITSQAFDTGGIEIPAATYSNAGYSYPGALSNYNEDIYSLSASLSIASFTGSLHTSSLVDRITYTLTEVESVQPFIKRFTINRLVAGASGVNGDDARILTVSANTNQFIYEPTGPGLKPSGQIILIDVRKQNLVSGSLTVNSGSGVPALTLLSSDVNGVTTFRLNGSAYSHSLGERIYAFTGSDEFLNTYSDSVKITPVLNFDGISVVLTNESSTFPAKSTGDIIQTSDLALGSGSVIMTINSASIAYTASAQLGANRFTILSQTASGVTANAISSTSASYSISGFPNTADSGSLELAIRYKAGDNSTTADFRKFVTYTKAKKAAPVLEFIIGNNNQSTDAKSTGEQIGAFANSSLVVKEQYNGSATFLNLAGAPTINSSSAFTTITKTATLLTYPTMASGTDSVELSVTGSVVDSEGVSRTVFGNVSLTKLKKAAPVLEFVISNNNQSADAKSTGVQLTSFSDSTLSVREIYNGSTSNLTLSAAPTINSSSAFTTITKSATLLSYPSMASGTNSVELFVTGSVTDSEGSSRIVYGGVSLTKVKKAAPSVILTATPQTQTVAATSASVQTGNLNTVALDALEGTTSVFNSASILLSNFTGGSISTKTLTLGTIPNGVPAASASIGINYTDTEGTITSKTINVSAVKALAGASGSQGDPGTNGTNGLRTATGMVHYQLTSTSAPSNPTATSYTFSNGTFSGLTANWGTGAPTYASGNTNKYWYSFFTAVETSPGSGVGNVTFGNSTQAIGFSGLVSFTGANGVSDGSNALTFGVAGTTLINGSNISTGRITSTNISLPAGFNYANGKYVNAGTLINLDSGSIHTKNFFISSSGDAEFKGRLSAVGGTFTGELVAASGYFSGSIAATDGYIGNWVLTGPTLYASANNRKAQLSAVIPSMEFYSGSSLVVDINANTSLSPKTAATITPSPTSANQSTALSNQTYAAVAGTEYYYSSAEFLSGNTSTFSIGAGSALIGKTCALNATVGGATGNSFGASGDDVVPPNNLLYQRFSFSYGFRVTGPGGLSQDITTAYDGSTVRGGIGPYTISQTYTSQTLSTTFVLAQGTYTITPILTGIYAGAVMQIAAPPALFSLNMTSPSLSSIEAAIPVSKTELAAGGMQVVFSSTRFIEVQRANNSDFVSIGGGLTCTGDVTANTSDRRLKEDIRIIDSPLEKIENIRGVFFKWTNEAKKKTGNETDEEQVGFIAQEVRDVLPHIVKPAPFDKDMSTGKSISGENYLTIQYEKIVPLLLEGIKELKKEIDELKKNR